MGDGGSEQAHEQQNNCERQSAAIHTSKGEDGMSIILNACVKIKISSERYFFLFHSL